MDANKERNAMHTKMTFLVLRSMLFLGMMCGLFGCSSPDLKEESVDLLKKSITETYQENGLSEYVRVESVSDCYVVKETGNVHSGMAKVTFKSKIAQDGTYPSIVVSWKFKIVYDGGDTILIQDAEMEDSSFEKFSEFLVNLGYEE